VLSAISITTLTNTGIVQREYMTPVCIQMFCELIQVSYRIVVQALTSSPGTWWCHSRDVHIMKLWLPFWTRLI